MFKGDEGSLSLTEILERKRNKLFDVVASTESHKKKSTTTGMNKKRTTEKRDSPASNIADSPDANNAKKRHSSGNNFILDEADVADGGLADTDEDEDEDDITMTDVLGVMASSEYIEAYTSGKKNLPQVNLSQEALNFLHDFYDVLDISLQDVQEEEIGKLKSVQEQKMEDLKCAQEKKVKKLNTQLTETQDKYDKYKNLYTSLYRSLPVTKGASPTISKPSPSEDKENTNNQRKKVQQKPGNHVAKKRRKGKSKIDACN